MEKRTWIDAEEELEAAVYAAQADAVCLLCGDMKRAGRWDRNPPATLSPMRASLRRTDPARYNVVCPWCMVNRVCARLRCATCPAVNECSSAVYRREKGPVAGRPA